MRREEQEANEQARALAQREREAQDRQRDRERTFDEIYQNEYTIGELRKEIKGLEDKMYASTTAADFQFYENEIMNKNNNIYELEEWNQGNWTFIQNLDEADMEFQRVQQEQ